MECNCHEHLEKAPAPSALLSGLWQTRHTPLASIWMKNRTSQPSGPPSRSFPAKLYCLLICHLYCLPLASSPPALVPSVSSWRVENPVCLLCSPLYPQHLEQSLVAPFYEMGPSIAPILQRRKTKAKRGEVRNGVQNVRCWDHVRVCLDVCPPPENILEQPRKADSWEMMQCGAPTRGLHDLHDGGPPSLLLRKAGWKVWGGLRGHAGAGQLLEVGCSCQPAPRREKGRVREFRGGWSRDQPEYGEVATEPMVSDL